MFAGIPSAQVRQWWPRVEPILRRAVERTEGRYDTDDVLAALLQRKMQLWLVEDCGRIAAACVTEIVDYPGQRRCGVVFCAGEGVGRWRRFLARIEDWARAQGCRAMEIHGRPGWERILPGYARSHVILGKELSWAAAAIETPARGRPSRGPSRSPI